MTSWEGYTLYSDPRLRKGIIIFTQWVRRSESSFLCLVAFPLRPHSQTPVASSSMATALMISGSAAAGWSSDRRIRAAIIENTDGKWPLVTWYRLRSFFLNSSNRGLKIFKGNTTCIGSCGGGGSRSSSCSVSRDACRCSDDDKKEKEEEENPWERDRRCSTDNKQPQQPSNGCCERRRCNGADNLLASVAQIDSTDARWRLPSRSPTN